MADARPVRNGLFVADGESLRLVAARCAACGKLQFPAAAVCPYCAADGCATVQLGPDGRLRLFTVVQTRPPGYRGAVPFGFGVVELDGLCVVTRLTETRLDRLRPDLPMRLVVDTLHTDDDGRPVTTYAFAAAEAP